MLAEEGGGRASSFFLSCAVSWHGGIGEKRVNDDEAGGWFVGLGGHTQPLLIQQERDAAVAAFVCKLVFSCSKFFISTLSRGQKLM